MHCCHCGKKINVKYHESKKSSLANVYGTITSNTQVVYVCPRCGTIVHENVTPEEIKSLARAAHSEYQRGCNLFSIGMGNVSIGIITLILAIIFFLLAKKPSNNHQLVVNCAEFYVCVVLFAISAVLLTVGAIYTALGIYRKQYYTHLLKDINNKTFVQ